MPLLRLENFEQFAAINVLSDPGSIGGPKVVPQCAEISLLFTLESGKTGHIVLNGRYAGAYAGTVAQAGQIHTALSTGAQWTALAAFLATSTSFIGVTLRNIAAADQPILASITAPAAGSSASAALPSEMAAAITKRTAWTGPSGRGRAYVPGFATNALGGGNVIAAACVTALQNWANNIAGALTAAGYTHVLALPARKEYIGSTGTVHPARAASTRDVSSMSVRDNHWDSQRRRGLK